MATIIPIETDLDILPGLSKQPQHQSTSLPININNSNLDENTPLIPSINKSSTSLYELFIFFRNTLIILILILILIFFISETTHWPNVVNRKINATAQILNDNPHPRYSTVPLGLLGQRPWS